METVLLKTKNLTKKFGKELAVSDVSLTVYKNSIYGLLGPNGAGKSTTLKIITGILRNTSGEIFFDGHKWRRSDLKNIGSLIESPPLYDNLTAFENIKVHATLLGLPEERIHTVLKIVDMQHVGKKEQDNSQWG